LVKRWLAQAHWVSIRNRMTVAIRIPREQLTATGLKDMEALLRNDEEFASFGLNS